MFNLDKALLVALQKFNGVIDANVSLTMKVTRYSFCFNIEEVLGPNTFNIKFLYVCMDLEETDYIYYQHSLCIHGSRSFQNKESLDG